MTIKDDRQLSFQFNSASIKRNTSEDNLSTKRQNVVRSITSELAEKKKNEEARIFGKVISRLKHLR